MFFSPNPPSNPGSYIVFDCHVSLFYLNLEHFLRSYLSFLTLTFWALWRINSKMFDISSVSASTSPFAWQSKFETSPTHSDSQNSKPLQPVPAVKIRNLSNPFLLPNSSLFFDWMLIVERETSSAHFLLSPLYVFTLSFTTLFLTQIPLVLDFLRVSSAEKWGASWSKNRAWLLSCSWYYSSLGHTEFGASGTLSVTFRDSSLELLTTMTFLLLLAT